MTGGDHDKCTKDVPIVSWMIPAVRDVQSTMNVSLEIVTATFNTESWELTTHKTSIKRARSDPDHEATSVDVPIKIWYLLISPGKMQPDEMMLTVGATQLGNKKAEEGQELITKLRTRITAMESSDEQSGEIKAKGKGNVSADSTACKHMLK